MYTCTPVEGRGEKFIMSIVKGGLYSEHSYNIGHLESGNNSIRLNESTKVPNARC